MDANNKRDLSKKLLFNKEEAAEYAGVDVSFINLLIQLGRLKVTPVLGRKGVMINRVILEEYFYNVSEFRPDPKKVESYNKYLNS